MKKKIVMGLVTVGMAAMLLAGCGSDNAEATTENTEAVEEVADEADTEVEAAEVETARC